MNGDPVHTEHPTSIRIQGKADYHRPSRRLHNDSGEVDVFEAARYLSGYNDNFGLGGGASYLMTREERQGHLRAGRTSLDLPSLKYHHHQYSHQKEQPPHPNELLHHHQKHHRQHQQGQQIKDKKYKQPSSPGGRLAHFLNNLFSQAITSKKKKSSKSSSQSVKDEDESPSARRRRRSSISHFRSTSSTAVDTKSLYSSCSSFGFRSPPPYNNLNTPTRSFRSFSDHKEVLDTLSKHNTNGKNVNDNGDLKQDDQQPIGSKFMNWADEKFKFKNGLVEKITKNSNHGDQERKKETKKFVQEEVADEVEKVADEVESDSSSDLFELQIDYGFGFCSSGLPVYETTHLDSIKRPSATALINGSIQS
ncbi:hypothetical protein Cgig2_009427 [Carnegiea gigantea]|uniref:Protein BIG GRAIN 1-like E n=1 Tax=Carnegiea gigantea TaxID=171969 RepID=A0A9Q1JSJ8_9CARY|nr:hypothetical protein Cgig2_009427 [Carnegiea gigantea]